jgi:hypothetical protein
MGRKWSVPVLPSLEGALVTASVAYACGRHEPALRRGPFVSDLAEGQLLPTRRRLTSQYPEKTGIRKAGTKWRKYQALEKPGRRENEMG